VEGHLRRGRCGRCYDAWVKARPVGVGAICAGCEDRRHAHLRHYELGLRANAPGGRWVVLCHNCVACAESFDPPPRSIDGLKMRLARDRRWGDRRSEAVGRSSGRAPWLDRRRGDRRIGPRNLPAGILEADQLVIELEADYEEVTDDQIEATEEVTGIHFRIPLPE
jgi:hypothetical protein